MERIDALSRIEYELQCIPMREARRRLGEWRRECVALADAPPLISPRDIPPWVWKLDRQESNSVLRYLVGRAQSQDDVALLVVIASLRPGLLTLVSRWGYDDNEVIAEAPVVVLECPLSRRRRIAAGLLLDIHHRFWLQRRRIREVVGGDTRSRLADLPAPGELGVNISTGEQLFGLVCGALRAGFIRPDEARIIIETRVLGDKVAVAAARRGVTRKAIYERRQVAEFRLKASAA